MADTFYGFGFPGRKDDDPELYREFRRREIEAIRGRTENRPADTSLGKSEPGTEQGK